MPTQSWSLTLLGLGHVILCKLSIRVHALTFDDKTYFLDDKIPNMGSLVLLSCSSAMWGSSCNYHHRFPVPVLVSIEMYDPTLSSHPTLDLVFIYKLEISFVISLILYIQSD